MNTKPNGPPTGLVTSGCYARALRDCDGRPATKEHYVSRTLLERFGSDWTIEGTPWAREPKRVGAKALTAGVLCGRHNNALSPLDTEFRRFFDLLVDAANRTQVGEQLFDGEDLERWAMKLMYGVAASGNVHYPTHTLPKIVPPLQHLRILFGEAEMEDGCGLKYVPRLLAGLQSSSAISYMLNHSVEGPNAGLIFGITIKLIDRFQFLTSMTPVQTLMTPPSLEEVHLFTRPGGFVLGHPRDYGHIKLRWRGMLSREPSLIVRFFPPAEAP